MNFAEDKRWALAGALLFVTLAFWFALVEHDLFYFQIYALVAGIYFLNALLLHDRVKKNPPNHHQP